MINNSLLFKIEQDIANLLLTKLEKMEKTFDRASQIAKFTLAHLPPNLTDEQVIQIIPSLDDEYVELASVVHQHMSDYEKKYKPIVTEQVEQLIKDRHFDEASKLMKDYLEKKVVAHAQ